MPSIDELFPPSPREVYERAPLIQVACELRFPPILKIEQSPVEFQERIRHRFPLLEKDGAAQLSQGHPMPPEVLQIINAQMGTGTAYQFLTEDRVATVALALGSISLSTSKYTTWHDFTAELRDPLAALNECFRPLPSRGWGYDISMPSIEKSLASLVVNGQSFCAMKCWGNWRSQNLKALSNR